MRAHLVSMFWGFVGGQGEKAILWLDVLAFICALFFIDAFGRWAGWAW